MKFPLFYLAALVALSQAHADEWSQPSPKASASPSGKFVLRVLPGDFRTGGKPLAIILELTSDGERYLKKREFPLVNSVFPVAACISDDAEVFTFDEWHRMGYEHVVVWYAADGTVKREYGLEQLFPEKQLAEIRKKHRSVSSLHWRQWKPYINGPALIIPDALGGYVMITQGAAEYSAKAE
jgi:hypothetical protein